MAPQPLQDWLPASFIKRVRELGRKEFLDLYGASLFLLVSIRDRNDPVVAALAARAVLHEQLVPRRRHSMFTTGLRTHIQSSETSVVSDMVVPGPLTREPRFVALVEPRTEGADRVVIGRGGDNDVVLRDVSVSKHHACLLLDRVGAVGLCDLGSTNGTFVNGVRLDVPNVQMPVGNGDELRFGRVRTLLCDANALRITITSV